VVKLIEVAKGKLMRHPDGEMEEWVYLSLELC